MESVQVVHAVQVDQEGEERIVVVRVQAEREVAVPVVLVVAVCGVVLGEGEVVLAEALEVQAEDLVDEELVHVVGAKPQPAKCARPLEPQHVQAAENASSRSR